MLPVTICKRINPKPLSIEEKEELRISYYDRWKEHAAICTLPIYSIIPCSELEWPNTRIK